MRYGNEIKVGIVFLLGLFVIIFGYFYLRGVGLGADTYYVRLNGAAQIAQGNDVRLQGVKIGQVQEVGFDPTTQQPILTLAVRRATPPFKLLTNYVFSVQSSGLVGENYVDIRGPYNPQHPVFLPNKPGQFIPGRAAGGVLSVAASAEDVVKDLRITIQKFNTTLDNINKGVLNTDNQRRLAQTLDGVTKLTNAAAQTLGPQGIRVGFSDPAAQREALSTLRNVERASRNLEVASRRAGGLGDDAQGLIRDARVSLNETRTNLNGVLGENRARLGTLLGNLDSAAGNVAGITGSLDYVLKQGGFRENAQLSFQSLRRAAENIEVATSGVRKLADDPSTQTDLRSTLSALRESTEALRDTAKFVSGFIADAPNNSQLKGTLASLSSTAANLEATTAGFAAIVGDPAVQADLRGVVDNLNGTLAETRGAAERVNGLLGGRKRKTDKPVGSEGAKNEAASELAGDGVSLTLRRFDETPRGAPGRNFGDLGFGSELFGSPFRLGISSIGDGNDLTLQSGKYIGKNAAVRYGIYRSDLGIGAELRRGRFSLEGNVWDLNRRNTNVYAGFKITPQLQIMAGRDSFGGESKNAVALRLTP